MTVENEVAPRLNIRLDPKIRYLTELAARARSVNLTDYVEAALMESFKGVSLDPFPGLDEEPNTYDGLTPIQITERIKQRHQKVSNPLSEVADNLWHEHPLVRIQLLSGVLDHLMTAEQDQIWNYLFTRKDLLDSNGKFDRKKVAEQWPQIKIDAMNHRAKKGGKGK